MGEHSFTSKNCVKGLAASMPQAEPSSLFQHPSKISSLHAEGTSYHECTQHTLRCCRCAHSPGCLLTGELALRQVPSHMVRASHRGSPLQCHWVLLLLHDLLCRACRRVVALVPVGSGSGGQGAAPRWDRGGVSMMADVAVCECIPAAPAGSAPHGEGPAAAYPL